MDFPELGRPKIAILIAISFSNLSSTSLVLFFSINPYIDDLRSIIPLLCSADILIDSPKPKELNFKASLSCFTVSHLLATKIISFPLLRINFVKNRSSDVISERTSTRKITVSAFLIAFSDDSLSFFDKFLLFFSSIPAVSINSILKPRSVYESII